MLPNIIGHINVINITELHETCSKYFEILEHITTYYTTESDYGTNHPWSLPIRKLLPIPISFREQQIIICQKV